MGTIQRAKLSQSCLSAIYDPSQRWLMFSYLVLVSVIKGMLDEKAFQDADGQVSDVRVVLQGSGRLS